ncbi:MAG TPA: cyclic nucleotide-binding domain-containing protein [Actinobacteria bacterium]|nr:cyclic nucleotide-binding domain-containing protein [Actinomycetota bacterium]
MSVSPDVLEHQLRSHPLVRGLPADDVTRLLDPARLVEFEALDVIFRAGDDADRLFLVVSGVVALGVQRRSSTLRIQTIHEGSILGWSWLFPPHRWQFDAVAETPVRAIAIDAAELRRSLDEDPAFGYRFVLRIAEVMANRLQATRRRLVDLMGA